jgi:uncharacterized protein YpmB
MSRSTLALVLVALVVVLAIGVTSAETKYIAKADVMKTMVQWNKDLGVKCTYCHVADQKQTYQSLAGKEASAEELDTLVHQEVALTMEGMMEAVNARQQTQFTCGTCHKGAATVKIKPE